MMHIQGSCTELVFNEGYVRTNVGRRHVTLTYKLTWLRVANAGNARQSSFGHQVQREIAWCDDRRTARPLKAA